MRTSPQKDMISKEKLSMTLDYIFGRGTRRSLNFANIEYQYSQKTGRLRYVLDKTEKKILFTLRSNGSIAPTIDGANLLAKRASKLQPKRRPPWVVTVVDGVSDFVAQGRTVFSKHIVNASERLLPGEDVVVLNERGDILAVGKSVLSGKMMKQFKRGVGVKVREGASEDASGQFR